MIENNRGYKNKSLQSWAVSYRGKQCLPHQRSLETLASSLVPVKPIALHPSPAECVVLLNTYGPKVSLTVRAFMSIQNVIILNLFSSIWFCLLKTRENKSATGMT